MDDRDKTAAMLSIRRRCFCWVQIHLVQGNRRFVSCKKSEVGETSSTDDGKFDRNTLLRLTSKQAPMFPAVWAGTGMHRKRLQETLVLSLLRKFLVKHVTHVAPLPPVISFVFLAGVAGATTSKRACVVSRPATDIERGRRTRGFNDLEAFVTKTHSASRCNFTTAANVSCLLCSPATPFLASRKICDASPRLTAPLLLPFASRGPAQRRIKVLLRGRSRPPVATRSTFSPTRTSSRQRARKLWTTTWSRR